MRPTVAWSVRGSNRAGSKSRKQTELVVLGDLYVGHDLALTPFDRLQMTNTEGRRSRDQTPTTASRRRHDGAATCYVA